MIHAALVLVVAQSCAALLPPADAPIDWFRNGQPFARDEPVRATARGRVYQRIPREGGPPLERALACLTVEGRPSLRDQLGTRAPIILPLNLAPGGAARVDGASVRRVATPADAAAGSIWFSETRFESRLVGVRRGVGIEEVRTIGARGGSDVLRAVVGEVRKTEVLPASMAEAVDRLRTLQLQVTDLQRTERALRDSLGDARVARAVLQRSTRDSLNLLVRTSDGRIESTALAAARLIADSAARLPSGRAARAATLAWPGAGHMVLGEGGKGWALLGAVPMVTAIAALALPDTVFSGPGWDPHQTRRITVAGSAAAYLVLLFTSRAQLHGMVAERDEAGLTQEGFLRGARVQLAPNGRLGLTYRRATR